MQDIVEGRVPLDAVAGVVPNFNIGSDNSLEDVCKRYEKTHWRANPKRSKEVLEELTILPKHPDFQFNGSGHWVREEDYTDQELDDRIKLPVREVESILLAGQ